MRLKYYIRGIGIGIIFTTLIFVISLHFGSGNIKNNDISDEEIIKRATELGMTMDIPEEQKEELAENLEKNNSEEPQNKEEIQSTEPISDNPNTSNDYATSDHVVENSNPDADTKTSDEAAESVETSDDTVTYVPFTVKGGDSSEVVSSNLYKAGLVDSVDSFNKYMNKLGVDNRIQSGTFYVKQDSSYDDLIALLVNKESRTTSPPKNE